jgi:hypothetical protein
VIIDTVRFIIAIFVAFWYSLLWGRLFFLSVLFCISLFFCHCDLTKFFIWFHFLPFLRTVEKNKKTLSSLIISLVFFLSLCIIKLWDIQFFFILNRIASYNSSCKRSLLTTDFLNLCLVRKSFFPPFEGYFYWTYNTNLMGFPFKILNISLHSLLACMFSEEKSSVILSLLY